MRERIFERLLLDKFRTANLLQNHTAYLLHSDFLQTICKSFFRTFLPFLLKNICLL